MPAMMMMQLGVMVVIMVMVMMVVMVVMVEWEEPRGLIEMKEKIICEKISFVVTPIAACNENRLGRHDE